MMDTWRWRSFQNHPKAPKKKRLTFIASLRRRQPSFHDRRARTTRSVPPPDVDIEHASLSRFHAYAGGYTCRLPPAPHTSLTTSPNSRRVDTFVVLHVVVDVVDPRLQPPFLDWWRCGDGGGFERLGLVRVWINFFTALASW